MAANVNPRVTRGMAAIVAEIEQFLKEADRAEILRDACAPWRGYSAEQPIPDGESPLMDVFLAGVLWAERRLAQTLGVTRYEPGDGTESLEGDFAGTLTSILQAAGLMDEDGEPVAKPERDPTAADLQAHCEME